MFVLVVFTDENNIAVIPDNWLEGTSCAVWPNNIKASGKIMKAVMEKLCPEDSWPAYPVKELYRNESYTEVRRRLKRAEEESDLATTTNNDSDDDDLTNRMSKRNKRAKVFSDSDSEDETPTEMDTSFQHLSSYQRSPNLFHLPEEPLAKCLLTTIHLNERDPNKMLQQCTQHRAQNEHLVSIERDLRLFTTLEKMQEEQGALKEMLGQVLTLVRNLSVSGLASGSAGSVLPEEIALPVAVVDDIQIIEEQLGNTSVFNGLVNYLCVLGGRNLADTTRRIMGHVMVNNVAVQFNWHGKKGKLTFGKLKLCSAVQRSVLKNCKGTLTEVEREVREWLRTASARDGGGGRREHRKQGQLKMNLKPDGRINPLPHMLYLQHYIICYIYYKNRNFRSGKYKF